MINDTIAFVISDICYINQKRDQMAWYFMRKLNI